MAVGVEKHRFDISLEDLQTFIAVANLGGIGRAARHLNLSQPSVSNRIRRLEEKLKVKLMQRGERGIVLTGDGEQLHEQSVEALIGLNELLQRFHSTDAEIRRPVNLSVAVPMAQIKLPCILSDFQNDHVNIAVHVHEHLFDEGVQSLLNGRCDFAVVTCETLPEALDYDLLVTDESAVVVSHNHPLAVSSQVTLEEALQHPVLLPREQFPQLSPVYRAIESRGLKMKLAPEAEGVRHPLTLMIMAAAGLGIVISPRSVVPAELRAAVTTIAFSNCVIPRQLGLAWVKGRRLSPQAKVFRAWMAAARAPDFRDWPEGRRVHAPS